MFEIILISIVALVLGIMWGGLHSTLWLEMHIPTLHKLAKAARKDTNARMPSKTSHAAFYKFSGSLVGTGATAGAFSFLGDSVLVLSFYSIGLFVGFIPALLAVAIKYFQILSGLLCLSFIMSKIGVISFNFEQFIK